MKALLLTMVATFSTLPGCSVKEVKPVDVCEALKLLSEKPLENVLISGNFVTDARHSSYFEGVECKGAVVMTYLKRKDGTNELDAIGGEKFLSEVFRSAMQEKIFSYRLVARGTLFPSESEPPKFVINEIVELTPRQQGP